MEHKDIKKIDFSDTELKAKRTIIALWLLVALSSIAVISSLMQINLLSQVNAGYAITQDKLEANDARQQTIGVIQVVVWVAFFVLFLIWTHRSHKNLPALNSKNLEYSPGWAVGWFFIPIFFLFRPYQVMKEIWKASDPNVDINNGLSWKNLRAPSLVGNWWGLFIMNAIAGRAAMNMSLSAKSISDFYGVSWVTICSDVISVVLAIVTIYLVKTITNRQKEKFKLTGNRLC